MLLSLNHDLNLGRNGTNFHSRSKSFECGDRNQKQNFDIFGQEKPVRQANCSQITKNMSNYY